MLKNYNKLLLVLIPTMMFVFFDSFASQPLSNMQMLKSKPPVEARQISKRHVSFMKINSDSWFLRYNPVALSLGGLMYVYQRFVSPQLPSECLYVPSCSGFSRELINDFGIIGGVVLTSDRLMRCNRLAAMDVNPMLVDEKIGKVFESTQIYRTSCPCGR